MRGELVSSLPGWVRRLLFWVVGMTRWPFKKAPSQGLARIPSPFSDETELALREKPEVESHLAFLKKEGRRDARYLPEPKVRELRGAAGARLEKAGLDAARRKVLQSIGGQESAAGNGYSRRAADGPGVRGPLNTPSRFLYEPHPKTQEAFASIGRTALPVYELVFSSEGAGAFHEAVSAGVRAAKYGAAVHVCPPEEYQRMRLFLTGDASAGFALNGDEIVSVFRNVSIPHSIPCVDALFLVAVREGGRQLDCFDTILPSIYAPHGFVAVAREPWDDQFAPEGWDKATFAEWNNGEPDVVRMVYDQAQIGREYGGRSEGRLVNLFAGISS